MPKTRRKAPSKRRVSRKAKAALGGVAGLALMGMGAGTLTEKLAKNLGLDLGGLEAIVPAGVAFSVGGPLGAVGQLFTSRLPDFFGDQPTREGV